METTIKNAKILLKRGDLTQEDGDAIVNAANPSLMGGGGVDGAIHRGAGPSLLEECKRIREERGPLPTGQAVVTGAGHLKAKHVIHTVGPIYTNGENNEAALLGDCYRNCLELADQEGFLTICFPSISTGAYGFPIKEASQIAMDTVVDYLRNHNKKIQEVRHVLFSDDDLAHYVRALEMGIVR